MLWSYKSSLFIALAAGGFFSHARMESKESYDVRKGNDCGQTQMVID